MVDRNGNTVLAYAPAPKGKTRHDSDPIEQSGQAIVGLLNEAAETARATCEEAVRRAQKLSHEFRAAEDKVHVHDLHRTMLSLLGLEHTRLTYSFLGREQRLTDVGGQVDLSERLLRA